MADMAKTDKSKSDGGNVSVKRANESIGILPKGEKITLLTRRLFNILLFLSQQDGVKDRYRRPLKDVLAFSDSLAESKNTSILKEQLRKMRRLECIWNTTTGLLSEPGDTADRPYEERWGVSGMIKEAEIIGRQGRARWIEWEWPSAIQRELLNPALYTRMSLLLQNELRAPVSMALYEICQRYASNPSKVTCKESWEWWKPRLTGNPKDVDEPGEYKYFNRDYLQPAMGEINQVTDLEIELLEFKVGRRVAELQFRVNVKRQPQLNLGCPTTALIDAVLLERIIRLGIDQTEAATLYSNYEEAYLRTTMDFVENRIADSSMSPIQAPAAYLRNALKQKFGIPDTPDKSGKKVAAAKVAQDAQTALDELRAAYNNQRLSDVRGYYEELLPDKQAAFENQFIASDVVATNPRLAGDLRRKGFAPKHVEAAFLGWLAEQVWGPATDADLVAFAAIMNQQTPTSAVKQPKRIPK